MICIFFINGRHFLTNCAAYEMIRNILTILLLFSACLNALKVQHVAYMYTMYMYLSTISFLINFYYKQDSFIPPNHNTIIRITRLGVKDEKGYDV